ncbi:hypothetical protein [Sphingomonas sp. RIT328]|uniref:hypothetical protein n=1 Tax=Sphingomonas sp. RIT328 TaxID=1470591 RepID=UPI000450212D|nr:hypothetical protein [Sphingomonas sp. RIT328]EZP49945.1 hypothetical protein BW41_03270 [Sphingomonas sp. RIT328]
MTLQTVDVPCALPGLMSREAGPIADPLACDHPDDLVVPTTARRLQRLAIVAADVGARFAREAIPHDPVAWLLAPRGLFGGACALDACQERDAFVRATLLHGLSLGLDADGDDIDALLAMEVDDDEDVMGEETPSHAPQASRGSERLFTGTVEGRVGAGGRCLQAFCATVAPDEEVFRRRLSVRYGEALGAAAVVQEGFDPDGAVTKTLLSDAVRRMLATVARDPGVDLGLGLDLQVEQRFAA